MEQNPYESPKTVSRAPTIKTGMAIGVLLLLAIPSGCFCGGITCFSAGIVADRFSSGTGAYYIGWLIGLPIGLVVVVLIPVLAVLLFGKRKDAP
jgi:hypothetical protein